MVTSSFLHTSCWENKSVGQVLIPCLFWLFSFSTDLSNKRHCKGWGGLCPLRQTHRQPISWCKVTARAQCASSRSQSLVPSASVGKPSTQMASSLADAGCLPQWPPKTQHNSLLFPPAKIFIFEVFVFCHVLSIFCFTNLSTEDFFLSINWKQ